METVFNGTQINIMYWYLFFMRVGLLKDIVKVGLLLYYIFSLIEGWDIKGVTSKHHNIRSQSNFQFQCFILVFQPIKYIYKIH